MISDEAVEAAKKVAYERYGSKPDTAYLRTILVAAAPHMLEDAKADAWDEGASDGQWNAEHIYQIDAGSRHSIPNPYRSQA